MPVMADAAGSTSFLAVSALSHEGLLRDHNEDSLVVGAWTVCASVTVTPQTLLFPLVSPVVVAVADGLGGHPAGEHASSLVALQLARVGPELSDEAGVRAALSACNETVYREAAADPSRTMMGTTVAGVCVTADSVLVFNVGDSRVYGTGPGGLRLVSVDDSPPLAPGETHTVTVTQTLGGHPARTEVHPHVRTLPLGPESRFLVCSDGLSDVVPDAEIAAILLDHFGGKAVFQLWRAAIDRGGPDNITVALVEIGGETETAGSAEPGT
jgi:PPM family protein phosphatase